MSVVCYELDEVSKKNLMEMFPPKYPVVKYDHITVKMDGINAKPPKKPNKVEIVGIADDGNGIEAFIVMVDGTRLRSDDGRAWHITASIDTNKMAPKEFDIFAKNGQAKEKPYKPVTSNGLLKQVLDENGFAKEVENPNWKVKMFEKPIEINVRPRVCFNVTELATLRQGNIQK